MKYFLTGAVCAASLLISVAATAKSGYAQTYTTNAGDVSNTTSGWYATSGSSGNREWTVNVLPDYSLSEATTGTVKHSASVSQISLTLLTASPFLLRSRPAVSASRPCLPNGSQGEANILSFGSPIVLADRRNGPFAYFTSASSLQNALPSCGSARVTFEPPKAQAAGIARRELEGTTQINALAPELPGVALLLPALLPVGLVLRKEVTRYGKRK